LIAQTQRTEKELAQIAQQKQSFHVHAMGELSTFSLLQKFSELKFHLLKQVMTHNKV